MADMYRRVRRAANETLPALDPSKFPSTREFRKAQRVQRREVVRKARQAVGKDLVR